MSSGRICECDGISLLWSFLLVNFDFIERDYQGGLDLTKWALKKTGPFLKSETLETGMVYVGGQVAQTCRWLLGAESGSCSTDSKENEVLILFVL